MERGPRSVWRSPRPGLPILPVIVLLVAATMVSPAAAAEQGLIRNIVEWLGSLFGDPTPPPVAVPPPARQPELFPALARIGFERSEVHLREGETVRLVLVRSAEGSDVRSQVAYAVEPIGAGAVVGEDVTALRGVATFARGERRVELPPLTAVDDTEHEGEERVRVVLSDPREAELDPSRAAILVTIEDNDPAPRLPRPARLVAQPAELVFRGRAGDLETVVRNDGEEPARIRRVDLVGRTTRASSAAVTPFRIVRDPCSGTEIPPGGRCAIAVSIEASSGYPDGGAAAGELVVSGESMRGDRRVTEGNPLAPLVVAVRAELAALPKPADPMAELIARKQRERHGVDAAEVRSLRPTPPAPPPQPVYKQRDEDYTGIGIDPSRFSFPVDRSRAITVDRVIPCVLEGSINSQLPGIVKCQVEQHVYGGDGRFVLIPAGTKAIGDYKSLEKPGDTRLNVLWRRFLRPDGASIQIAQGFQAQDAMGRTGLPGEVDNRFVERFGGVLFLTSVSAGAAFATGSDDTDNQSASLTDAREQLADGLGRVSLELLEQNLDLRPITTIAAGTRLHIQPIDDLWFPTPYRIEQKPGGERKGS